MTRKVSVTEFRNYFGRYIDLVISGDVLIITKYGKEIAMLAPFLMTSKLIERLTLAPYNML